MIMRLGIIGVVLMGTTSPATGKIMVQELTKDLMLDVQAFPGHVITLEFPEPVTQKALGNELDYELKQLDDTHFTLETKARAPRSNLNMETWSGNVVMKLRPAPNPDEAVLHIRFIYPRTKPEENESQPKKLTPEQQRSIEHRAIARFAMQAQSKPVKGRGWDSGDHSLRLRAGRIIRGKKLGVFPFTIENTGDYPYPVTAFQLQDRIKRPVTASFHVHEDVLGKDSLLMPGAHLQGAFVLETPTQIKNGWRIHVSSIKAVAGAFWNSYPPDYDFTPGKLELRTMVALQALGGSMSLSDHLGLQRSAWGMVTGVGLRVAYGFSRRTALDVGLDVVRTSDITIDTDQGAIQTMATGGRLHFGGMLSTGDQITPYARLGLGLMFANHHFSIAGSSESEFRVAATIMMGAGVDWWINDRVVIGLSAGGAVPFGGQDTGLAFQAGLRVGMGFGKLREFWEIDP